MNNMAKQMDMFDEGGLMDEGGTVDPVSGNDVPPGSTQEEVRDDIPAQLSEGEFVFPADVVRFIGLEKLMKIRQRAKAGLQRMEDMGQMGNSEEAIMPDTLPFSIEDLDMEDEDEYNTPQEFNQGGMPVPDPNAGVYYNPAIQPTTGVAPTPVTAASSNIARSIPKTFAQAATPMQAGSSNQPAMFNNYPLPQAPVPTMPKRDDLPPFMGGVVPGVGSGIDYENEVYVNDAGLTITFRRYLDGSLKDTQGNVAVIPEGYKIKSEADKDVGTGPVKVESATVPEELGGGAEDEDPEGLGSSGGGLSLGGSYATTGPSKGARVGTTQFGVSYDIPGQKFGGIPNFISNLSKAAKGTLPSTTVVSLQRYGFIKEMSYEDFLSLKDDPMGTVAQDIMKGFDLAALATANQISINEDLDFQDKNGVAATYGASVVAGEVIANNIKGDKIAGTNLGKTFDQKYAELSDVEQALVDNMYSDKEEVDLGKGMTLGNIPSDISTPEKALAYARQQQSNKASPATSPTFGTIDPYGPAFGIGAAYDDGGYDDSGLGSGPDDASTSTSDSTDVDGMEVGDYKGAFVGETYKKNKLAKQMKRSGLASKK